jgi:hypothetical protein
MPQAGTQIIVCFLRAMGRHVLSTERKKKYYNISWQFLKSC